MQLGDVVALGGRLEDLTANMGLLGPEVPDAKALNIPLDQAEILVTEKSMEGKVLKEFRNEEFAGQIQLLRIERGGVPIPLGADTELKRFDVLFVAGLKSAVEKIGAALGKVARPSTGTDLLTLSVGMVLGLLVGQINVPVGSFSVGLGNDLYCLPLWNELGYGVHGGFGGGRKRRNCLFGRGEGLAGGNFARGRFHDRSGSVEHRAGIQKCDQPDGACPHKNGRRLARRRGDLDPVGDGHSD